MFKKFFVSWAFMKPLLIGEGFILAISLGLVEKVIIAVNFGENLRTHSW